MMRNLVTLGGALLLAACGSGEPMAGPGSSGGTVTAGWAAYGGATGEVGGTTGLGEGGEEETGSGTAGTGSGGYEAVGGSPAGGDSSEGGYGVGGTGSGGAFPQGGTGSGGYEVGGTGSGGYEMGGAGSGGYEMGGAGSGGDTEEGSCLANVAHCFNAAANCFEYSPWSDCDQIVDVCAAMQDDCGSP